VRFMLSHRMELRKN